MCDYGWARTPNLPITTIHYDAFGYLSETTVGLLDTNTQPWEMDLTNFPLLRLRDSSPIVGTALNGVFFFGGTSHYGYDVFSPRAYGLRQYPQRIKVDICLGTADHYGVYRYHSFSPCIYMVDEREVSADCRDDERCRRDMFKYATDIIPKQLKSQGPIGIAKDGRIIYGPFNSQGLLW